jgi:hypothetical protein
MSDNALHGYPRDGYRSDFYIQDLGTAEFYGLEFIDTQEDLIVPNQNLTCKPNVLIEGNKIVLDYTGCGVQKDKDYIDTLFKSMAGASGFTLSTAIYNDPINNYEADLAGSCTLNSYNNYKIIGTFSAIGSTIETNYYQSRYFESVPQISSITGLTSGVTLNALINYTTGEDTSFLSQNFVVGDYVDVATSSNNARLVIAGITVDTWGREIITFAANPRIVAENLKGVTTEVQHKRKLTRSTSGSYPTTTASTVFHRVNTKEVDGKLLFTIDGVVQPALRLMRGVMYIFLDETFPLNSFLLSETPDGTQGGGIAYSDIGTYSVIDNKKRSRVFIMVPNDLTPNELFYYSESKSNMGSAIQVYGSYPYGETPASLTTNQQFNLQSSVSNTNSSSVY